MWQTGLLVLMFASQLQFQPVEDAPPSVPAPMQQWSEEPIAELPAAQALPATTITSTWLPQLGARGFGMGSIDLRHAWLMGYDDLPPLTITPGGTLHTWTGSQALNLPARVYDTYIDAQWMPWSTARSSLLLGATPGLYGDYENIDGQTFQWSGWLMGTHRVTPKWMLVGGVAYLRQLKSNWLPLGGAIWSPSETTRVEFVFPRPRISKMVLKDSSWQHWAYVTGLYGGGAWAVADTPTQNVLLGYSDLRLLAGWEALSRDGLEWHAEFGYVFDRQLSVDGYAIEQPSDSIMAQLVFAF